jgi:hypothetical protein
MARKTLSEMILDSACLLLAAGMACLWSGLAVAQDQGGAGGPRARFAIAAGFDVWADLNDLRTESPGEFDSAGFVIDFSAHWRMKRWASSDLLFGFDVGGFTHDSDVFHVREDVISRSLYLTPSVKWQFGSSSGPRYSLDAGLGYYLVDIAELETYRYYGYYCCYAEEQLWEDSSLGGFIGTTIDFADTGRGRRGGFTMGAKIHWADLGRVRDEGRFRLSGTLGRNAGRLRGPVYAVQLGYVF